MAQMPPVIDGNVTLEWLVLGAVALFRHHVNPFSKPARINGACVVHIYSPTSCEIKGMVSSGIGKDMLTGYRKVVDMMAKQGYSGVKMEVFDDAGNSRVWIDGKRQL